MMDLDLSGKNVLVTGSSRGIGLGILQSFLNQGCNVVANGRTHDTLVSATKDLKNCFFISGDVTNELEAQRIVKESVDYLGSLDVVVCNVGNSKSVKAGDEDLNEWNKIISDNFFSAVNIIQSAKHALKLSKGSIICISSICGHEIIEGAPLTYSVSKSALNYYVKGVSRHLNELGVRINAVSPGNIMFKESLWEKKIQNNEEEVKEMLKNNVPLKRFGTPDDIANLTLWLSSPLAKNVTGAVYISDGGQIRS